MSIRFLSFVMLLSISSDALGQMPVGEPSGVKRPAAPMLAPGVYARVTLEVPAGEVYHGKVVALSPDSIVLSVDLLNTSEYTDFAIPRSTVRAIDVRTGSSAGAWAVGGLMIGAILGGVAGSQAGGGQDNAQGGYGVPSAGTAGGLMGAVLGGLLGAIVGATSAPERWVPAR